jgi:AcrR family transcriptional regulator
VIHQEADSFLTGSQGGKSNRRASAGRKAAAGRPLDEQRTRAILNTTLELGIDLGFERLTVEAIARRSGVGKTTIYRRWPNVWAIVADACLQDVAEVAPVIEHATARESLTESMLLVARAFRGDHGRLLRPLIGRAQFDIGLQTALGERWLQARRNISRRIIRRGMRSGELRSGLDPDTVLDALYGALYHRLLLPYDGTEVQLPQRYVHNLIDTVFEGLTPRTRPKRRSTRGV